MRNQVFTALASLGAALLLGGVIMAAQGFPPLATYAALAEFSVGSLDAVATTLKNSIPLILTGLSASVAFASGPVNLGQPGQLVMGALFATAVGLALPLPAPLLVPAVLLAALLGGALWAGLAAWLRRAFGMSEFITTLMLNAIAELLTYWAILVPLAEPGAYSPQTPPIRPEAWLPDLGPFSSALIVLALAAGAIWFVVQRWTAGYEWRLTGQNSLFARLGGCRVDGNFWAVMLTTGALAGLAGGLVVMAGPHRFIKGLGANYAWDGIMIAVVANNGLAGTLLYGVFFAALQTGSLGMELITAVPSEFIQVLQAMIVLVVVAGRGQVRAWLEAWAARRRARAGPPAARPASGP